MAGLMELALDEPATLDELAHGWASMLRATSQNINDIQNESLNTYVNV